MTCPHRITDSAWPGQSCRGDTLIGLLVGLALGLGVVAVATRMLADQLQSHREVLQGSRLNHDLRSALAIIALELQDAQYLHDAHLLRLKAPCSDAFCGSTEDFDVTADRLEFSHDRNANGTKENNECAGFRLSAGELQFKTACSPATWTALTDAGHVRLTRLGVSVACRMQGPYLQRRVQISLSAQWPQDSRRSLSLQQQVHLRNALPATSLPAYCKAWS